MEKLQLTKLSEMKSMMPDDIAFTSCKSSVDRCGDHRMKRVTRKNVDRQTDGFSALYSREDFNVIVCYDVNYIM